MLFLSPRRFFYILQKVQLHYNLSPNHTVASYLIKPVQRITKYSLLLEQLTKHCPDERGEIRDALEITKNVPKKANDAITLSLLEKYDVTPALFFPLVNSAHTYTYCTYDSANLQWNWLYVLGIFCWFGFIRSRWSNWGNWSKLMPFKCRSPSNASRKLINATSSSLNGPCFLRRRSMSAPRRSLRTKTSSWYGNSSGLKRTITAKNDQLFEWFFAEKTYFRKLL